MRVYVKIFEVSGEFMVAICDENVLGLNVRDDKGLVLNVNEEFYKGQLMSLEEGINILKRATIANIVGENIVKKAVEEGLIHEDSVIYVLGVPHAQLVRM